MRGVAAAIVCVAAYQISNIMHGSGNVMAVSVKQRGSNQWRRISVAA